MINYLYHLLHLILKMPALCLDACSQTTSPLLHCAFNNSVIKCRPLLHKSLSQMCNITYACLVHPFLQHTPDFVINWIEVRTVGWPLQRWEVRRFSFQQLHSVSSPVRRCTVLLEDKEVICRQLFDGWQQMFGQQHITIVGAVDLDPCFDEDEVSAAKLWYCNCNC